MRARDDRSDRALLHAVRHGDDLAYDALYRRHVAAVRALARRCAARPADADDLVSDVFADALRAIRNGRGPIDSMLPYLLRSVRHAATDRARWGDAAHAVPMADAGLDRHGTDTPAAFDERLTNAFHDLSPRFRDVLWATAIEGGTAADLGPAADLSPGAFASLALRARRALRRSYLLHAVERRCPSPECTGVRRLMPGVVLGDAAPGTTRRVEEHVVGCARCAAALDSMRGLATDMSTLSYLGWAGALLTRLAGAGAAGTASTAVPVAICVSLSSIVLTGAAPVTPSTPAVERDAATFAPPRPSGAPSGSTPDDSHVVPAAPATGSGAPVGVRAAVGPDPLDPGAGRRPTPPPTRPAPRHGAIDGSRPDPAAPTPSSTSDATARSTAAAARLVVDRLLGTSAATDAVASVPTVAAGVTDSLVTTVDGTAEVLSTAVTGPSENDDGLLDDAIAVERVVDLAELDADPLVDAVLDDGADQVTRPLGVTEGRRDDVVHVRGAGLDALTSVTLDDPDR